MKNILILLLLTCGFGCSNYAQNSESYSDKYNIGSISMPAATSEKLDTIITPKFKLVASQNMAYIDNKKYSPSTFSYDCYFPTILSEFDFFEMKKDSVTVNRLLENMINGAQSQSNSEIIGKTYFTYPEPGVKVTLLNHETNTKGVCRIIIFDNYVISTRATGANDNYENDVEDKFFKSLKINPETRKRH